MENNGYNVATHSEQEDANAANGEPLSVKAKAYSMPGVTVDGTDPLAVYETVKTAVDRARGGQGPTLVESKVYRLSAHGNLIAPPGVPLHYPEHEAITVFGNREEYEAALRGDPVPRFRARLIEQGTLDAARADEIAKEVTDEMEAAVSSGSTALSRARSGHQLRLRLKRQERAMAREIPYIAAVNEAIQQEMARDETVVFYGQDVAPSDEDPLVQSFGRDRVRVIPISETAEIGMAVGLALAGYRPIVELLMAEFMLVAMNQVTNEAPRLRYMSGGQVKVPLVLKAGYGFTAGWAGQHTGSIYTMFAGIPGLKVVLPSTPADAKGLMAAAVRDDNPVVYLMHYLLVLEHGDVPEGEYLVPSARRRSAGPATTSPSWPPAGPSARRWRRPRRWRARASTPRSSTRARCSRSTCPQSSPRWRRPGTWCWPTRPRATPPRPRSSPPRWPSTGSRRSRRRSSW